MQPKTLFVTGATGLVGSHVVEEALARGHRVRALVRASSDTALLKSWGIELVEGDLEDIASLERGCAGADWVINCAAMVGDWGDLADFRRLNVDALRLLLDAAASAGVGRFVHVSSLGVYEARDHNQTDESTLPAIRSLDAYTRSKTEAEILALAYLRGDLPLVRSTLAELPYVVDNLARSATMKRAAGPDLDNPTRRLAAIEQSRIGLPVTVVRPGFIYGERDRTVLPKLLSSLKRGVFRYFGSGEQLLNCIYVKNLVQGILLAAASDQAVGEAFNLTDGQPVTKRQFVSQVAAQAGLTPPTRAIPLGLARVLANSVQRIAQLRGAKQAPLINKARYKFLGLNLDFSVEKARHVLGYNPAYTTEQGLAAAVADVAGRSSPSPTAAST